MDRAQFLGALLGSAAVGVLISSILTEVGRWRERKSRREELALAKAADLARLMYEGFIEQMKLGHPAVVRPQTEMIRDSYRMFKHLLDEGVLDPQTQEELDEELGIHAKKKAGH